MDEQTNFTLRIADTSDTPGTPDKSSADESLWPDVSTTASEASEDASEPAIQPDRQLSSRGNKNRRRRSRGSALPAVARRKKWPFRWHRWITPMATVDRRFTGAVEGLPQHGYSPAVHQLRIARDEVFRDEGTDGSR